MKLSKTSSYATLAMVYLAAHRDAGPTQAKQVAEHLGLPVDSTLKILQALARHQLIRSQLGRTGGYIFHRDPCQLKLLEVVEAIDGPIHVELPIDQQQAELQDPTHRLEEVCMHAAEQLRVTLGQCSIDTLSPPPTTPFAAAG